VKPVTRPPPIYDELECSCHCFSDVATFCTPPPNFSTPPSHYSPTGNPRTPFPELLPCSPCSSSSPAFPPFPAPATSLPFIPLPNSFHPPPFTKLSLIFYAFLVSRLSRQRLPPPKNASVFWSPKTILKSRDLIHAEALPSFAPSTPLSAGAGGDDFFVSSPGPRSLVTEDLVRFMPQSPGIR